MPFTITATINTREVDELLRLLPAKYVRPATKRAVARASASTAALAVKMIQDGLGIKPGEIKRLKFVQVIPNQDGEGAKVVIKGQAAPLEIFKGTRVRKRAGVRTIVAGKEVLLRHAFSFPGFGGPIIVQRKAIGGKIVGRGPVERLFGPAPAIEANKPEQKERLKQNFAERFEIEVLRDLEFRLSSAGKGISNRRHGPATG